MGAKPCPGVRVGTSLDIIMTYDIREEGRGTRLWGGPGCSRVYCRYNYVQLGAYPSVLRGTSTKAAKTWPGGHY